MTIIPFSANSRSKRQVQISCLTLPVAPQVNSRIRYADDQSPIPAMMPMEAVAWIGDLIKGGKQLNAVDIKGPGDALAAPGPTFETLDLVNNEFPEIETRITTLALGVQQFALRLAAKGVNRVNLVVDAVTPAIIEKIYAWIRPKKKTIPLAEAAELLLQEQGVAMESLKAAGMKVNIQTTIYPGINDLHVESIAEKMALLGASSITLLPFRPGKLFAGCIVSCDASMIVAAEKKASAYLEVIKYDEELIPPIGRDSVLSGTQLPKASKHRPNVAVVSSNGMDVDLHLGQAHQILVYGPRDDGLACLLESRPTPIAESGTSRWQELCRECLHDCFVLLAANVGENPKKVLAESGIKVFVTEDNIEGTVDLLYGGGKKKKCTK